MSQLFVLKYNFHQSHLHWNKLKAFWFLKKQVFLEERKLQMLQKFWFRIISTPSCRWIFFKAADFGAGARNILRSLIFFSIISDMSVVAVLSYLLLVGTVVPSHYKIIQVEVWILPELKEKKSWKYFILCLEIEYYMACQICLPLQ